jgi:DNA-binding NarL/FixJ family response regulator
MKLTGPRVVTSSGEVIALAPRVDERSPGKRAGAPIRVLIAERERLVRAGLRAVLEREPDMEVVGEAADGQEAVALAGERPDVALVDVRLAGLDGFEVARRILADAHVDQAAVLMLTPDLTDADLFRALRAGATGLMPRDSDPAELRGAVRVVAAGGAQLSPGLTRRLIDEFAAQPLPTAPSPERLTTLTPREREVMALAAVGLSNVDIAERLVISPATAKTHVSRAMVKLGARDRASLVTIAYESGLVQPRVQSAGVLPADPAWSLAVA